MTDMTERDLEDLAKLNSTDDIARAGDGLPGELYEFPTQEQLENAPAYHPILQVWREVLKPADTEMVKKVTPQWATRILSKYAGLTYADMNAVRDGYFGMIKDLRAVLDAVIATDPDCLTYGSPEEDVEENSTLYLQVLMDWQKTFLVAELDWDCTAADAAARVAAIAECHEMFFGPTGLTAYLDNIRFEFTEADQAMLQQELQELRESKEG